MRRLSDEGGVSLCEEESERVESSNGTLVPALSNVRISYVLLTIKEFNDSSAFLLNGESNKYINKS